MKQTHMYLSLIEANVDGQNPFISIYPKNRIIFVRGKM